MKVGGVKEMMQNLGLDETDDLMQYAWKGRAERQKTK